MTKAEGNMTNLEDSKTRVTAGYNRTLTVTKLGDWHDYQNVTENSIL